MADKTTQQIAATAIEFIKARQSASELKARRADILSSEKCAGENDCYLIDRLPLSEWCDRCKRSQVVHSEYRKAATRRGAALRKLVQLVAKF